MSTPLESTKSGKDAIASVSYTHDGMIDLILAHPEMSQGEVARYFGYTEGWVSRVMGSDAFNARLAARKSEIIDPKILSSMEEKIKGLAHQSLDVIQRKLEATQSPDLAVKALELSTKALGMGARPQNVQNNTAYVVALPQKAPSEDAWVESAKAGLKALAPQPVKPAPAADVVDVEVKS